MDGGTIVFVGACVLVLVWLIYMMTCRTDDFIKLVKADEERKAKQSERLGKAVKGASLIAKMFLKK